MTSVLKHVWATTRSGWRYAHVGCAFVLGARPVGPEPGYAGGTRYPEGGWLIWGPGDEYVAFAVTDQDFPAWLKACEART